MKGRSKTSPERSTTHRKIIDETIKIGSKDDLARACAKKRPQDGQCCAQEGQLGSQDGHLGAQDGQLGAKDGRFAGQAGQLDAFGGAPKSSWNALNVL